MNSLHTLRRLRSWTSCFASLTLSLSLGLSLTACASTKDSGPLEELITRASEEVYAGHLQTGVSQLEAALPETLATPREELRVAYYLTQAHLLASLGDAFLIERSSDSARSLGTGARYRPSPTSHLVALVYHASSARALLDSHDGGLDRRDVEGNLRLATATTLARMGFHDVASRATEQDPELLSLDKFTGVLARYDLPEKLGTWLAVMAFDAHRKNDEQTAYRFAILAIEGGERFGLELPDAQVKRLEHWILQVSGTRFLCPESGTPYVPGLRRSPRSGISHYDYESAPRVD